MAFEFKSGEFYGVAYQKANQGVIDALESITPYDIGLSQPYLKITAIDPKNGKLSSHPLNYIFQKPSNFGHQIASQDIQFGESVIHGERPPVSIDKMVVSQQLSYGDITFHKVQLDIVVHRPDALFGSTDDEWASLMTPGREHLIEYGWTGMSKNPMLNDGYEDKNSAIYVPTKRKMLFVVYEYDFSITDTGEIKLSLLGYDTASFLLRSVKIGESPNIKQLINTIQPKKTKHDNKNKDTVTKTEALTKNDLRTLTKIIQQKLENIDKDGKTKIVNKAKFVSLKTILDYFVAETVKQFYSSWGFDDAEFIIGDFNKSCGKTQKKYGGIKPTSIGDFLLEKEELAQILSEFFTKFAGQPTLLEFTTYLINHCNSASCWMNDVDDNENKNFQKVPNIKVKVAEKNANGKKLLSIFIFDNRIKEFAFLDEEGHPKPVLDPMIQSRSNIKKYVVSAGVPFVTLGKKLSFINTANFTSKSDPLIQAQRINRAVNESQSREEYFRRSDEAMKKGLPDPYHEIFASMVNGEITMLGNFAFDAFSTLWIDFRVNIWSGTYNVVEKTDTISNNGFTTSIKVMSDATDPLNTRKRRTKAEFEALVKEAEQIRKQSAKQAKKNQ